MTKLQKRSEVPVELTWNLEDLYPSLDEVYRDMDVLKDKVNTLSIPDISLKEELLDFLKEYEEILALFLKIGTFLELNIATDHTNLEAATLIQKGQDILSKVQTSLTVVLEPLYQLEDEILNTFIQDKRYGAFFKDILNKKKYRLRPGEEELLSALAPVLQLPYELYEGAKFVDLTFPSFSVNGKEYPLSFVLFENKYEYEEDTSLRRKAFDVFSNELRKYHQSIGTAFLGMVKRDLILARQKGYDSVFDYLLMDQEISKDIHHHHLDTIMEELSPIMRKYSEYLKNQYSLDSMTYADLKLPPKLSTHRSYSIDEAKEVILASLTPFGHDYIEYIKGGFENRWVDFVDNIGKSTGGFCTSIYQGHPYILMTWQNLLSDVFTLAHELGHGGHFHLTDQHQSILVREASLYFIEAPSTTSELLLSNYLQEIASSKEEKKDIIALSIANTYYHNFVTHFLEGYFQREVYQRAENGETLTPHSLNIIMEETLQKFWGDSVVLTPGAELTWMRQPHYYTGLYSYTYSAGLTLGTILSQRLPKEPNLANTWLEVLKLGGSKSPKELAQFIDVDITNTKSLSKAISHIGYMVDELIK
ncbi:MAG: oligoendopeptidase F [Tissierellia bacterium]|nr:oligoendopeptidase F [Tissierellia bacterium]